MMRHFVFLAAAMLVSVAPSAAPAQVYGNSNALVDHWYRTYLGRAPDSGMSGWVARLNQGTRADQVLAGILGSDEYYRRAGSTPQGYITLLYNQILQRPPTGGELEYWLRRMYTTDRSGIADDLLTHNPGVWVESRAAAQPPAPPRWERDRHEDWDRHHDIHEYHRPDYRWHRDEHDDRDDRR